MDQKALTTLEFPKILEKMARHASFSLSAERALAIQPSSNIEESKRLLEETGEARRLLEANPQTGVGGARDVRVPVQNAGRGMVLLPTELLDIKATVAAGKNLARTLIDKSEEFPLLGNLAAGMPQPAGLVDSITKAISPRAEILDSASPKLASIRSEVTIAHERLLSRMQKLLNSETFSKALQEPIVTQRDGRYVLPIRAEARGKIKAIVHDQSGSGATLFVEPLQVVELNNKWRELQLAEKEEERRILLALTALVAEHGQEILAVLESLARLDLAFARARYADELNAHPVELMPMRPKKEDAHPGVTLRLFGARHPLLDPQTVVSLDIELFAENYCLVITGPNTGGKTVTLKTVGLMALMSQCGMHIPADPGSQLSFFDAIYADIGDEQSIEQSLSTFSGHVTNIVNILKKADQRSLVILDELGAGTDPQEGAALARSILDHLVRLGITTLVATHYSELKLYAHATKGVVNASVEFDLKTLAPTYNLTVGLPGRSNALAIATRLGIPPDVIDAARGTINLVDLKAEDLLDEIHRERDRTREAHTRAEEAQHAAQKTRTELAERLEKIEDERVDILEKARHQAQSALTALQDEVGKLRAQLARARQPLEDVQNVKQVADELEMDIEEPARRKTVPESAPNRPLRLGDAVRVRSLGTRGIVIGLGEEEAEIQIGALRARSRFTDLDLLNDQNVSEKQERYEITQLADSPGNEISLRGQRFEDAFAMLDRYLDAAYAAGLRSARIIHGKGTGTLRDMVRDELKKRSYIERYTFADPHEGGEGVTVAFFKED